MTVEVIKLADGSFGWQLRDEHGGALARPHLGGFVLPPDPERERRSRIAVQEALRQQYEAQQAAKG